MESKAKFVGHPFHPQLIVFPLGLLVTAIIFDIIYLTTQNTIFATIAYYDIAAGLIGALLAALFGWIEWSNIPAETRAKRIGLIHGIGNMVLFVLFLSSWLLRQGDPGHIPSTLGYVLSFAGGVLGLFTAWLGGEMVYRLNIAVDPGANPDAPSSLTVPVGAAGMAMPVVPVTGRRTSRESMRERERSRDRDKDS